eukprot:4696891-Prymnesium_polylepis.1
MQGGATVFHEHYKGMWWVAKMYGIGSNTRGEVLRRSPHPLLPTNVANFPAAWRPLPSRGRLP